MMDKIDISDEPIKTPKEDKYGFAESAKELAKKIINLNTKGSTTISIEESWGNGKTSYCNLIKYHLRRHRRGKNIEIIDFIPFVFDTDKQLINEFVDLLIIRALNNDISLKSKYKIQKYFKQYFSEAKLKFPYNILNLFLNREKDFNQRKNEINKIIEKTGKKYIIFIDDLDRIIEKEKIISVLKLIKYIADLNQIVFIINIDRNHINKVLVDRSKKYLDKFIQHREIVPIKIMEVLPNKIITSLYLRKLNFIYNKMNNLRFFNFYKNFKKIYFEEYYHEEISFLILFYLLYEKKYSIIDIYAFIKSKNLKNNKDDEVKIIKDYLKENTKKEKSISNDKYFKYYILYNIKEKNIINIDFVMDSLKNISLDRYHKFIIDILIENEKSLVNLFNYFEILELIVNDDYFGIYTFDKYNFDKSNLIQYFEKLNDEILYNDIKNKNKIIEKVNDIIKILKRR